MKPINDGGPAFGVIPSEYEVRPSDGGWLIHATDDRLEVGMTLRDYFAGQALAGMLASESFFGNSSVLVARWAYAAADAMIAERAKAGEES